MEECVISEINPIQYEVEDEVEDEDDSPLDNNSEGKYLLSSLRNF